MADQRSAPIKKDEVAKAVRNRHLRLWGSVAVGTAAIALAFIREDGTIPLLVVAGIAFGVEAFWGIARVIK